MAIYVDGTVNFGGTAEGSPPSMYKAITLSPLI